MNDSTRTSNGETIDVLIEDISELIDKREPTSYDIIRLSLALITSVVDQEAREKGSASARKMADKLLIDINGALADAFNTVISDSIE